MSAPRRRARGVPGARIVARGAVRVGCSDDKCRGIMWRVDLSRLEEALGHEGYRCDTCGARIKTIPVDDIRGVPDES